jgi:hypothetical protein
VAALSPEPKGEMANQEQGHLHDIPDCTLGNPLDTAQTSPALWPPAKPPGSALWLRHALRAVDAEVALRLQHSARSG